MAAIHRDDGKHVMYPKLTGVYKEKQIVAKNVNNPHSSEKIYISSSTHGCF